MITTQGVMELRRRTVGDHIFLDVRSPGKRGLPHFFIYNHIYMIFVIIYPVLDHI